MRLDLNADVGESGIAACDEELLGIVTSVSIACGVHGGSEETIERLSLLALERGVGAGAHPGVPDGRRERPVSPAEAGSAVRSQVKTFLRASRAPLQHVKLHGVLYHAARDPLVARAVVEAMKDLGAPILIAQAGSPLLEAARAAGLRAAAEAFLDREYRPDGTLVPRGEPGALLSSPDGAAARAVEIALRQRVSTRGGGVIAVMADTLCVHGDTPGALAAARAARSALEAAGANLRPLGAR
jgi:UPF0271 protein